MSCNPQHAGNPAAQAGNAAARTPLYGWHAARGARMSEFAGYDMPLWYPAGVKSEHRAVLETAGLFDTSHMSVVTVAGSQAFELLQRCFSRDLTVLDRRPTGLPGRCLYGVFLDLDGGVVDDAVVYRLAAERYMVVANAGMGPGLVQHLEANRGSYRARLEDLSGRIGKMDLQGPLSARIFGRLLENPAAVFERMDYFSFRGDLEPSASAGGVRLKAGISVLVSRTGYTGEFGFELFVDSARLTDAWELIVAAGRNRGLIPCGLAARDSLRAGAGLPLAHQDIGPWPFVNNPWTFVLPCDRRTGGFSKNFVGDKALLQAERTADHTRAFVGFDVRKVSLADRPAVLDEDGEEIGEVLTCVSDTAIGLYDGRVLSLGSPDKPDGFVPQGLCCGFLKTRRPLDLNRIVTIKDHRRRLEVKIVNDIRPDRSARCPITQMMDQEEKDEGTG